METSIKLVDELNILSKQKIYMWQKKKRKKKD